MARPSTARDEPKLLSRRVLVVVKRDQTTATPRVVWQHEIPILEAIFGEGNVTLPDPSTMDDGYSPKIARELLIYNKSQDPILPPSETASIGFVFIGSPAVEYERLVGAYGMHPEVRQSYCENVYGRFQENRFSGVLGRATLEDLPEAQLRQLVRDFGGEDRAKDMKAEDLSKLAAELGVEVA